MFSPVGFKGIDSGPNVAALLVSASKRDHALLRLVFSHSRWTLHSADNSEAALSLVSQETIPVIICNLCNGYWKVLLEAAAKLPRPPKLIVSSRLADVHLWAELLKLGGHDVLARPLDAREVFRSVSMAWDSWQREDPVSDR